ncbi:MAG: tRNA pseudouridine(55) synthase TruB [Calothrix sp. SM1_5_4]|nr:tRNA pseudouridine(55) synthase TruB [Calothrix sp. SM1_5_4]
MQFNGLLLVDKPAAMTSHDVVARVRKILKQKTVGHTGTLDPLATGLMVLVLGDATKLSDYLVAEDKAYRVKIRLGVRTDTLDRTGQVLQRIPCDLSEDRLRAAILNLQGEFEWEVPLFSAAKVDGKKLYEHGREGTSVELPKKQMSFRDVEIHAVGPDWADVSMSCSKGSFVRTWAAELGESLGVGGIVEELRRLRVGGWGVDKALGFEDLEAGRVPLIPMSQALPGLKSVMANTKEIKLVGNGQIPGISKIALYLSRSERLSWGHQFL